MGKVVEDPSFATYLMTTKGSLGNCDHFLECKFVAVPYVVDKTSECGWVFPKGSSLYPLFDAYISLVKESGLFDKMKSSYKTSLTPTQSCPVYDGKPIGSAKCFSLFGLLSCGAALSMILLL